MTIGSCRVKQEDSVGLFACLHVVPSVTDSEPNTKQCSSSAEPELQRDSDINSVGLAVLKSKGFQHLREQHDIHI